jgi:capsular polysaccharide biosynthesis protein
VCYCSCAEYYLLMAGSCVDQNIIIGVFAGVGGGLLIALVIALICTNCKSKDTAVLSDEIGIQ